MVDTMTIDVTDAQAVEIILTLPWQFGELKDGEACFSEDEIQSVLQHVRNLATSLEAAEADRARLLAANAMLAADLGAAERDAAKWREMHDDRDRDLQHEYARANATEAEVALLREALTEALDELRKTQQDMADWYEFGPPTNLAKTQKTRLSDEVASTKAEVARLAALEAKSREHADALAARARELLAENGELVQEVARLRAALNLIDEARANALAECERLRAVLADIAEATNVDDPESYRCDDREGCLDWVYAKAMRGQDAAGG
jgi:DNA repair exonuclease SbcCD ATPase subunit